MTNRAKQNEFSGGCYKRGLQIDGEGAPPFKLPKTFTELHNDILHNIFSYLSYADLTQARLICRRWMDCIAYKHISNKFCLCIRSDNVLDIYKQLKTAGSFASGTIYSHIMYTYGGTIAPNSEELQLIVQKLGLHARSLRLKRLFPSSGIYEFFPNIEHLVLDGFFPDLPFKLNNFRNLRGIYVGFYTGYTLSRLLLTACLRINTQVTLEELGIQVYGESAELFLTALADHALTLKSLNIVYYPTLIGLDVIEPNLNMTNWLMTFGQLRKLQKVKIDTSATPIFESTLHCLQGLPLRYLDVYFSQPVNATFFKVIESCAQTLEHLAFFGPLLSTERLEYFTSCIRTDPSYNTISEKCINLKKLILRHIFVLDESELCNIAANLRNLEVLVLSHCENAVTNRSLAAIFQYLTQLRELDISGTYDFDIDALKGTTNLQQPYSIQRLSRLVKLNFECCQRLSNKEFLKTLKLPMLRFLSVKESGHFSKRGIKVLVRQCPLLEEITVTPNMNPIGNNNIFRIAKYFPRIRFRNKYEVVEDL